MTGAAPVVAPLLTIETHRSFNPQLAEERARPYGATVAEIVSEELAGATADQLARTVVTLVSSQGEWEIYAHLWARTRPVAGMTVRVHVRIAKGGLLKAILSVAVFAAASFLGPLIFGAGFLGTLGTAAIAGVGMLAINALIPVEKPKQRKPEDRYSISGAENDARPYGRIPEIHGKIRFAPPYASLPYTESIGEDRYVRFLFMLGYADTVFTNWLVGETPLEEFDDYELQIEKVSPGDPWPFSGFPNPVFETEETIGLKKKDGFHVRRSARNTDFHSIEFLLDRGLGDFNKKGKLKAHYVIVEIWKRPVVDGLAAGPWVLEKKLTIREDTHDPFRRSHSWLEPEVGQLDYRVRRTSKDGGSDKLDSISWVIHRSTRPVRPVTFNRPLHLGYLRIKANAQAQGILKRITTLASSVRRDWDPDTESWVVRETQSPAAHSLRVIQGPANPFPAADEDVDLKAHQDLAEFCILKGLKANVVHDADTTVDQAHKQILRGGRAFPTRYEGVHSLFIDRPQTRVRGHLTAVNATNFSGDPLFEEPVDALRVMFNDETDNYRRTERLVPRPGLVGEPQTFEEVDFSVYTDPRLNWIEGRRLQYEREFRWERLFAEQDAEHLFAPPGSLVRGHFLTVTQRQSSAYVRAIAGDYVVLDQGVEMREGEAYACIFRTETGVEIVRGVETDPTEDGERRTTIRLKPGGQAPKVGDLAMFGLAGQESEECVVKAIDPMKGWRARLTMVAHAPQIEALSEQEPPAWFQIVPEPRPWANQDPAVPVIVSARTIATAPADDDDVVDDVDKDKPIVVVTVRAGIGVGVAPTDVIVVTIGSATESATVGMGRVEFEQFDIGQNLTITAQAFSIFGRSSAVTAPFPYTVETPVDPPPDVTMATATVRSDRRIRFDFEIDPEAEEEDLSNVAGVRIYGRPGVGWTFAELKPYPVYSGLQTASPVVTAEPWAVGQHTFAFVAVDLDDVVSETPKIVTATVAATPAPPAPTDFTFSISGGKAQYSARAGDAPATDQIRFRRGRPTNVEQSTIIASRHVTANQSTPTVTEADPLPPGKWRAWAEALSPDATASAAVQSATDLRVPGQLYMDDCAPVIAPGGSTSVATVNPNWSRVGGSTGAATYGSGRINATSGSASTQAAYLGPELFDPDHYMQIVMAFTAATASYPLGVRVTDANNGVFAYYFAGSWRLAKRVNGVTTTLGPNYTAAAPASGSIGLLKAVGDTATLSLDGVDRISGSIGAFGAVTRGGFVIRGADGPLLSNVKLGLI